MIVRTEEGTNVIKADGEKYEVRVIKLPIDHKKLGAMIITDLCRFKNILVVEDNPQLYDLISQEIALLSYTIGML